jgi:chromosome partitioning protein
MYDARGRHRDLTVIAVIQQKGGVGKSTITANLAAELIQLGRRVILLDLDPQQSLTQWAQMGAGLLKTRVRPVDIEERKHQAFRTAVDTAKAEADHVILDSPPGFPEAGMLAALVADIALLPVTPSPLDLMAAKQALELIREAQRQRGGKRPVIAFIPSKVVQSTTLGRDLPENLKALGEAVLPGISQRIAVAEAVLEGLTVREYVAGSDSTAEFGAPAVAVEKMVKP